VSLLRSSRSLSSLGGRGGDIATLLGLLSISGQTVNLILAVLLDEGDKVLDGAGAVVLNGLVLLAGGVQLDGREASDGVGHIVGSGIDLSHNNLLLELRDISVQSGELLVLGSQSLAVTAPGRVELDENVLLVVNDNLLVVLADDSGDGSFLGLGDGLGLDARLNLAGQNVLDELADLLGVELLLLVVGVLCVLAGLLDSEGGELLRLQVQVAGVSTEELGIQGDNVDVTTVLLSDGTEVLGELLTLLSGLSEDVGQGDTSLESIS